MYTVYMHKCPNGKVYIGTDPTNIVNTLAGRQKTTKGLHFEYINPRKHLCMERGDADG